MRKKQKEIIDIFLFSMIAGLVTLFVAMCLIDSHDGDFNWYCVLGKAIVNGNPNFHGVDVYSWIAQERGGSEIQHSWLGTVIAYGFSVVFKPFLNAVLAFIFVTAVLCALVFKLTFLKDWNGSAASKLLAHIAVVFVTIGSCYMARTRAFDCMLFTLAYYYLLQGKTPKKKIIVFGIVSLLWANLHGSSMLLYFAFLFVFGVMNLIPDFQIGHLFHQQNKKDAKTDFIALVVSVLAGMINPYGIELYGYALFHNVSYTKEGVNEWKSASFLFYPIVICFILLCVFFVLQKKQFSLKKLFPIVMLLGMTGIHVRMYMYLEIAILPMAFEIIHEADKTLFVKCKMLSKNILAMMICACCSACLFAEVIKEYPNCKYRMPSDELIAYLQEEQYQRAYNDYDLGAYLIFNGLPDFIDARADFFDEETLSGARKFRNISFEEQGDIDKFLDTFQFDAIILNQKEAGMIDYLLHDGWEIDYSDKDEPEEQSENRYKYVVLVQKQKSK